MNDSHDGTDWTDDERRALDELAVETSPSDLLEERIVRELRSRALLGRRSTMASKPTRIRRWLPRIAASLVLFLSGLATGQWLGARSTATAFAAAHQNDVDLTAVRVQEAGSAYVASLVALAALETDDSKQSQQLLTQGRQVALATLEAASAELLRLDPENADLDRVSRQLAHQLTAPTTTKPAGAEELETRKVIWF